MALVVAAVTLTSAEAQEPRVIPPYAHKVAGERIDQRSFWGVWVYGLRGVGRCWGTRTVEQPLVVDENTYCGFRVPDRPWQLAARGSYATSNGRRSMLFFLTRATVGSLRVVIIRRGDQRITLSMTAHRLTHDEARRAHMRPTFGYSSSKFNGGLGCIKKIVAISRSGSRVAAFQSPRC